MFVASGLESGKAKVRAKGLGLARPSNSQGQAVFAKVAMRIIGQQGLWISVRPKKQAHKKFSESLAEGQVDLLTQIDRIHLCGGVYLVHLLILPTRVTFL